MGKKNKILVYNFFLKKNIKMRCRHCSDPNANIVRIFTIVDLNAELKIGKIFINLNVLE